MRLPFMRRLKLRRLLALLAAAALALFVARDCLTHHREAFSSSGESDRVVSLMSQIGYLKHKLGMFDSSEGDSGGGEVDRNFLRDDPTLPTIYVVTPTYARPVQKAELTRLCHTLLLVPNVHWVVVEDSRVRTGLVGEHLRECGVPYAHLFVQTPPDWKLQSGDKKWSKPRGVVQRNEGLAWIRENAPRSSDGPGGVVYFADDDNTYGLQLFEEMRHTRKVSVWPVAFVGELLVEKPLLDPTGTKVVGWNAAWSMRRPYAVDMAGFAVNLDLLLKTPKAKFAYEVKRGYQESEFLKHLAALDELEPRSPNRVLVWHTRTEKVSLFQEKKLREEGAPPSNHGMEGI